MWKFFVEPYTKITQVVFLLFAPFSIKGHLVVFANEEQLERNGLQSLEIDDDNSPKLIYGNILSRRVSDLNSCF